MPAVMRAGKRATAQKGECPRGRLFVVGSGGPGKTRPAYLEHAKEV